MRLALLPALVFSSFLTLPALALQPAPSAAADAQRFGKYFGAQPVRKTPTSQALAALNRFRAAQGRDWQVRFSLRTGIPRSLFAAQTAPRPGRPEAVARAFLRENRDLLQVDEAELSLERSSRALGMRHLLFQQARAGLPVLGGHVKVHMTDSGKIVLYQSSYEPPSGLSTVPSVSEAAARGVALSDLGNAALGPGSLLLYPDPSDGALHLAWRFEASSERPIGRWVVLVDAHTAKTLLRYSPLEFLNCQTSGTVMGLVYPNDPHSDLNSNPVLSPSVLPISSETVWVSSYKFPTTTDANGFYCSSTPGKVFSSLQGPYVSVINNDAPPAHYDNGTGQWFLVPSAVSSPHPYLNDQVFDAAITVPGFDPTSGCIGGGTSCFAEVLPRFAQFQVGAISAGSQSEGAGWTDDDFVQVEDHLASPVGTLSGNRGPSLGPAVADPSFIIHMRTNDSGTAYGYDVDVSSYLVLTNSPQTPAEPNTSSTFTWVGGASLPAGRAGVDAYTSDRSLSEINAFYQVNRMHNFFAATVDANNAAAINRPLPVSVKFGPGINNAFYSPFSKGLFFGDAGVAAGTGDGPFALDATVVRHEYVHSVVDTIFPVLNFGQNGAWSEGLADYFAASSFQLDGLSAGLPHIGRYTNWYETGGSLGGQYLSLANVNGQRRDLDSEATGNVRTFPADWTGEVHADGLPFSQALWRLRKDNPTGSRSLGTLGTTGIYKADIVAFQSLFYFPESFEEFLEAAILVSSATAGFAPTTDGCIQHGDCATVRQAFADHGITLIQTGSDAYEPNDGPATATDISSKPVVSATIWPAGDVDDYTLALGPGHLHAVLSLPANPGQAGTFFAYQVKLLDGRSNVLAVAAPRFNVNPDPGGGCPSTPSAPCYTTDGSAALDFDVASPGQYYLMVTAGETGYGSPGVTASQSPYTLTTSYSPASVVSDSIVNATFDQDVIAFSVKVASFTSQYYSFCSAQLRDQGGSVLPNTKTTGTSPWLVLLSTAALPGGGISGQVRLTPGFAQRFPAVGTVYVEVFGLSPQGNEASLGLSSPLNLTSNTVDFKAWNNVFNPLRGQKATFRYDLSAAGNMTIKLYTTTGDLVKVLFNGQAPAGKGSIDWTGLNDNGNLVASGVYLARVDGPGLRKVRKVVVAQ